MSVTKKAQTYTAGWKVNRYNNLESRSEIDDNSPVKCKTFILEIPLLGICAQKESKK